MIDTYLTEGAVVLETRAREVITATELHEHADVGNKQETRLCRTTVSHTFVGERGDGKRERDDERKHTTDTLEKKKKSEDHSPPPSLMVYGAPRFFLSEMRRNYFGAAKTWGGCVSFPLLFMLLAHNRALSWLEERKDALL